MITKKRLYDIIFKTDTQQGKLFDEILLVLIFLGTLTVVLMSVPSLMQQYWTLLTASSAIITTLFAIEYVVRIRVHPKPLKYIWSFYGLIDLVAILPGLAWFSFSWHNLLILRSMRLLRLFRVFNLGTYESASTILRQSILFSHSKITVFLLTVTIIVCIVWTLMYLIEGPVAWFTSIPIGIYWSIVTITTVWYGDITPLTSAGQALSALLMLLWYWIIAIPTGLISAEMVIQQHKSKKSKRRG